MSLCLNFIFGCRFLLCIHLQSLARFIWNEPVSNISGSNPTRQGIFARVVSCCRLSPVKVLSQASECVHLCLIHNLLVSHCKPERKTVSEGDVGPLPVRTPVSEKPGFESTRGSSLREGSEDDSQPGKRCLMELSGDGGPVGDYATVCP